MNYGDITAAKSAPLEQIVAEMHAAIERLTIESGALRVWSQDLEFMIGQREQHGMKRV